jgi:antitoxin HigA-1
MARVRTHPGEVLREEFLAPLGMSSHQLAEAIDVPANRVSEIVREARSVTADTALRLAEHFKTTPEFWLNLQTAHDLSKAIAEAPGQRYATGPAVVKRREGSVEVRSPVTGKWAKREKEVAASDLSQRVKNKPANKGDRRPDKRK